MINLTIVPTVLQVFYFLLICILIIGFFWWLLKSKPESNYDKNHIEPDDFEYSPSSKHGDSQITQAIAMVESVREYNDAQNNLLHQNNLKDNKGIQATTELDELHDIILRMLLKGSKAMVILSLTESGSTQKAATNRVNRVIESNNLEYNRSKKRYETI